MKMLKILDHHSNHNNKINQIQNKISKSQNKLRKIIKKQKMLIKVLIWIVLLFFLVVFLILDNTLMEVNVDQNVLISYLNGKLR